MTYRSFDEACEKARWLQANPSKADEIARRGQARTLRSHGFESRIGNVEEAIALALR